MPPRTIVYIDGFNLYYGAVRGGTHKWLNLQRFFQLLRPHDNIVNIHYFTALVDGPTRPNQEVYLRALGTLPLLNIVLGKFKKKQVRCSNSACTFAGNRFFDVPEEKRTDVHIAIFLLDDAYQNQCDHSIVVSGDSDLVPAIGLLKVRFPKKRVTVYVPSRNPIRGAAVELRSVADKHRTLPLNLLPFAQFSNPLPDGADGLLQRPASW
jgi:6-hydroxy-3-succinoylpyridine 3-monooxygenase